MQSNEIVVPYSGSIVNQEMKEAVLGVLESGSAYRREDTQAFEREVAAESGVRFGVAANSGTSALILALAALGVGAGDEVILAANDYSGNLTAVVRVGARPRIVDVEPDTGNLDPALVADAFSDRTRAVVTTHLYGHPSELEELKRLTSEKSVFLVEDLAHAIGAEFDGRRVGSFGQVGVTSFSSKMIDSFSPSGMSVTDNEQLATHMAALRNHGRKRPKGLSVITGQTAFLDWRDWYDQKYFGFMMQMGDIPAALGRVQLRLLDGFLQRRRKAAAYYNQVFADAGIPIDLPVPRSRVNSSFLHYVVRSPKRAEIAAFLADRGIETGVHYPAPLHFLQPARELLGDLTGRFPVAEKWAQEILSLPVGPHLSDTQVEHVAEAVQAFFRA